jgi:hypothetical protein
MLFDRVFPAESWTFPIEPVLELKVAGGMIKAIRRGIKKRAKDIKLNFCLCGLKSSRKRSKAIISITTAAKIRYGIIRGCTYKLTEPVATACRKKNANPISRRIFSPTLIFR